MTDTPPSPSPHDPRAASAREERLGELCGDRLCTKCGFNLTGQLILREPHYHMVIVRCPECSTVASVQEYPLLGRWVSRWSALLAAVWFTALVALLAPTVGILTAITLNLGQELTGPLAQRIGTLHQEHVKAALAANPPKAVAGVNAADTWGTPEWYAAQNVGTDMFVDNKWWTKQTPSALIADAGGLTSCIDLSPLLAWSLFGIPVLVAGVAWSVALLHQPRRRVWLFSLVVGGITTGIAVIASFNTHTYRWSGWVHARELAQQAIGWPINLVGIVVFTPALIAGLLFGRSIVRGLIRLMLPPRLRGPLATLWLADGLTPPRTLPRR